MAPMFGREKLLAQLESTGASGFQLLLLGPRGIGKSTVLHQLLARALETGQPCGMAEQTRRLRDITGALARAYPHAVDPQLPQRHLRSRLRFAAAAKPGCLLLDDVADLGTTARGYLRKLRGNGLGVILAADVENRRERETLRALHLTARELWVPPLPRRHLAALLEHQLDGVALPHRLGAADRARLLRLAQGNPGRLVRFSELLAQPRHWHEGRVLAASLQTEVLWQLVPPAQRPSAG